MCLYRAVIEGFTVIPYFRMTQRSKWSKPARRYLDNQETLAWFFKKNWHGTDPIDYPIEISYAVHFPTKHSRDNDNVLKAIQDALQYAGIVKNDKWIQGTGKTRIYFDGKARLIIELRRL